MCILVENIKRKTTSERDGNPLPTSQDLGTPKNLVSTQIFSDFGGGFPFPHALSPTPPISDLPPYYSIVPPINYYYVSYMLVYVRDYIIWCHFCYVLYDD